MLTYKNPKAKSCVVCERVFVPERDDDAVCGSVCGLKRARAQSCNCRQCLRDRDEHTMWGDFKAPAEMYTFIVCAICGNKRCPHATDHRHACTNSNAPGQAGSIYA